MPSNNIKTLSLNQRGMIADDMGDMGRQLGLAYGHLLDALNVQHGAADAMFIRDAATESAIHLMSELSLTDSQMEDDFGNPVGGAVQTCIMMAMMLKRSLMDAAYFMLPSWNVPEVKRQESVVGQHVCAQYAEEVDLSYCDSGCKVYKCRICGTSGTMHSRVYGCRHPKAR